MKKLICAIMFLLSLPAASVHAQAFKEMTFFELSAGSGVKHHGITPVDFSFKLHVDLLPFAYIFIDQTPVYAEGIELRISVKAFRTHHEFLVSEY